MSCRCARSNSRAAWTGSVRPDACAGAVPAAARRKLTEAVDNASPPSVAHPRQDRPPPDGSSRPPPLTSPPHRWQARIDG